MVSIKVPVICTSEWFITHGLSSPYSMYEELRSPFENNGCKRNESNTKNVGTALTSITFINRIIVSKNFYKFKPRQGAPWDAFCFRIWIWNWYSVRANYWEKVGKIGQPWIVPGISISKRRTLRDLQNQFSSTIVFSFVKC